MSSQASDSSSDVIEMVDHIRETIARIDDAIGPWLAERQNLAVRLAAMEAAADPSVVEVAADFEARAVEGRPYEDAEDAKGLLSEAHRRYVT